MRLLFAVLLLSVSSNPSFSQGTSVASKPPLDTSVLGKWPELSGGALTPNGKYLTYILEEHMPVDRITTVVQSPDARWKRELLGIRGIQFSDDSRSALYLSGDTLVILTLGSAQVNKVEGVLSYRLVAHAKGEWLVYQLKGAGKALVIQDEKTRKQIRFEGIDNYTFSKGGEAVVLESKGEGEKEARLRWVNLTGSGGGSETPFWSGIGSLTQVLFSEGGDQAAFTTQEGGKRSVWRYKRGKGSAELIVSDGDASIDSGLYIGSMERFSTDGERLFFNLERRYEIKPLAKDAANVNVWRYNDIKLQPEQLFEIKGKKQIVRRYYSGINLQQHKVYRIQRDFDEIPLYGKSDDNILALELNTDQEVGVGTAELSWSPAAKDAFYFLISKMDGNRKKLSLKFSDVYVPRFSALGKFLIYRPYSTLQYHTYEISTGKIVNATGLITTDLSLDNCYNGAPLNNKLLLDVAGWLNNDSYFLAYDKNDIWLVDPLGLRLPENITNGYGKNASPFLDLVT